MGCPDLRERIATRLALVIPEQALAKTTAGLSWSTITENTSESSIILY